MTRLTRSFGLVLLALAMASPGLAAVDLQTLQEFKVSSKPLDVAVSPDGKYTFVLAQKGAIQVYSPDGSLRDTINVDPGVDQISVALDGNALVLTNSTAKKIQLVSVDFQEVIDIAGSPIMGKAEAPVAIAVFSDFQ